MEKKLVDAHILGANATLQVGADAKGVTATGGIHLPSTDSVVAALPRLTVPDRSALGEMGNVAWETVSLEELVLHPGAENSVEDAMDFLRDKLQIGEKSMQLFDITGPTGDGKTTLATALVEKAKQEGMHVRQFQANEWLTSAAHESTGRMVDAVTNFVGSVRDGVKQGKPAKAVMVINEAHMFAGMNTRDAEVAERVATLNNLIDDLGKSRDMQIVLVLTSRLPLAPDLTDRASWRVEMTDPDDDARAEVLYRLLIKQVDQTTHTSDVLDDQVLKAVLELGTWTPEKQQATKAYLSDMKKRVRQESDPEMVWAENFFGLTEATRGFSFRDMGTLVERTLRNARRKKEEVTFDKLAATAADVSADVRKRHALEMSEGTRRYGGVA